MIGAERALDASEGSQNMKKLVDEAISEEEVYLSTTNTLEGAEQNERDQRKEANSTSESGKSRPEEIQAVIKSNAFEVVGTNGIVDGARILDSRFVNTIKSADAGVRDKSRLIAQKYSSRIAATIAIRHL